MTWMKNKVIQEFIPYDECVKLHHIGFRDSCLNSWHTTIARRFRKLYFRCCLEGCKNGDHTTDDNVAAPLYQQAFRWFRDTHNIYGLIDINVSDGLYYYIRINEFGFIPTQYLLRDEKGEFLLTFKKYEEAQLVCLKELIKIIQSTK